MDWADKKSTQPKKQSIMKEDMKRPTKAKRLKILLFLRGVLKERNCYMCNEIGLEFPEYNMVHLRYFLPELHNERPSFIDDGDELFVSWGTDYSVYHFDKEKNKAAIKMWNFRKQAVENAIDAIKLKKLRK